MGTCKRFLSFVCQSRYYMEGIRLKNWENNQKVRKRAFIVTDTIMEKLGYVESVCNN